MQVLKENVRKQILKASIKEFKECGYKNASMRRIAAEVDITAGNIYRYFPNKQALLQASIQPVKEALEQTLLESTEGKISWEFDSDEILKTDQPLKFDLKHFSKGLIEVNQKYPDGMQFLSNDATYREYVKEWLKKVLYVYYAKHFPKEKEIFTEIISSIASVTLIDSVSECLHYQKECRKNMIDESEIVYHCLSAVLETEELR